jgi:hypothetical protein
MKNVLEVETSSCLHYNVIFSGQIWHINILLYTLIRACICYILDFWNIYVRWLQFESQLFRKFAVVLFWEISCLCLSAGAERFIGFKSVRLGTFIASIIIFIVKANYLCAFSLAFLLISKFKVVHIIDEFCFHMQFDSLLIELYYLVIF